MRTPSLLALAACLFTHGCNPELDPPLPDPDQQERDELAEVARTQDAGRGELEATPLRGQGVPVAVQSEPTRLLGRAEYSTDKIQLALLGFRGLGDAEPLGPPHLGVPRKADRAAPPRSKSFDGHAPEQGIAATTASPTFQFSAGSIDDPINIGGHPSDANIAAGRSAVCVTSRAALACYSKGGRLILAPTRAADFFSSFSFTGIFDLRANYDHFRDRFWITGLTGWGNSATDDKLLIAVSKTNDPRDGFYQYWTNAYGPLPAATGNNADYPLIGIDSTGVYISNIVDITVGTVDTRYTHVVLFRASQMAAGLPMSSVDGWRFWNLTNPDGDIISGIFTPANAHTSTTRAFFVNRRGGDRVDVYALNNPLSAQQSWTVRSVTVDSFGSPGTGPQLLDSVASIAKPIKFDNLGTAPLAAQYRAGHLLLTTNDERNWDGMGDRPSVRLIKLEVSNLDAIQVEIDRTFGARAAGETSYFSYGWAGAGINASSELALAYVRTGSTIYPQVRVSSWLPGDLDIRTSALAIGGAATFQIGSSMSQIWYDTANASIDPVDDDGIYFAQQYPTSIYGNVGNNFRLRVIKMFGQTRPDVLPLGVSTAAPSVTRGNSFSVSLTIANDGDATMPAFTGELRLSTNDIISTLDTLCATTSQTSLSYLSDPRVVTLVCTAPTTMTPGTYFIGARLDTSGVAEENDETNNANPTFLTMPTIQVL